MRKMTCPDCRVEMNHHADKLLQPTEPGDTRVDPVLGGILEEHHACPECGQGDSRIAPGS